MSNPKISIEEILRDPGILKILEDCTAELDRIVRNWRSLPNWEKTKLRSDDPRWFALLDAAAECEDVDEYRDLLIQILYAAE